MPKVLKSSYEDMVQKAQNFFWTKGYKGVSAQELAEHLGVSTSTIYNKYSKEMLFLDSLKYYNETCSDPFLRQLRETTNGLKSLREFFYQLIDALLTKTFPKSCLMVNTVVELRNENDDVKALYDGYFSNLLNSYKVVLNKAYEAGEIKDKSKIDEYAEFLLGVIFELSIMYKIHDREVLVAYIDDHISLIT